MHDVRNVSICYHSKFALKLFQTPYFEQRIVFARPTQTQTTLGVTFGAHALMCVCIFVSAYMHTRMNERT